MRPIWSCSRLTDSTRTSRGTVDIWQGVSYGWIITNGMDNDAFALNGTISTATDTAVTFDVSQNDYVPSGDSVTSISATNGSHGTTSVSGSIVTYTPASGFQGNDSFTYTITDSNSNETTGTVNVTVDPVTHFAVTGGTTNPTAGDAVTYTVTALDSSNNAVTSYNDDVEFSSTDPQANLPSETSLTDGAGTFTVTYKTAGDQFVQVFDPNNYVGIGDSATATVSPNSASKLAITTGGATGAGTAFYFDVTALDDYGNVATGFTDTLNFTSSDSTAALPNNTALSSGYGSFRNP